MRGMRLKKICGAIQYVLLKLGKSLTDHARCFLWKLLLKKFKDGIKDRLFVTAVRELCSLQ